MDWLIPRYTRMLAAMGHSLTRECKILDFCCGRGDYVLVFRDAGYDAYGFEPFEGAPSTSEFATFEWPNPYRPDRLLSMQSLHIDWTDVRLPYPDAHFDFVFSQEVMEHVEDHNSVLKELARITKPSGAQIHTFPPRYQFMENHLRVPLGGVFKSPLLYRTWLRLAPFNPWPVKNLTAAQLIELALWYANGSLNYLSPDELMRVGARYFAKWAFIPHLWERTWVRWWYTRTNKVVWFLGRPL
jgi:SAM-dependent methyltransferase